ncbi:MAG: cytochrome c oxidase subunit II [gamma proteobacterium symbiont of Ctena orbiculata]|uniref:Cytochrome c oxidase subunit 2 n=1 Tax=Candidatus Thiodiazotropha taylori TaxID=2792791 RepID=A0A944MB45_9GAMM|nr:cytochrome c oxidase subunit II [Candidatus Thiodiazotropha taylori]PUB87463.1 MAG: cytochrome c oxidase subunit II [gamma proteobacterium symbiont of Ctena orbiculata]MBT2988643.1 cytochrome c oxidase subunit II [Candidatus Thiodiazotropha taylori]MBT2996788.1 cytochrome c oxidase subunit II [Candidatus Thiodiazotropha taylori]MBT3002021.1 cytochrome c oxidase subunit II [Candidatus Thiodiazotropha taylori]
MQNQNKQTNRLLLGIDKVLAATLLLATGSVSAEYGLNFPEPAANVAQEIFDIHMMTMGIATFLLCIVFAIVFYSLYFHRKSRGYEADQEFHNSWFGNWSWVIVPVMVLGVDLTIAGKADAVLKKVWDVPKEENIMDVKVTGHQWWWEFDYLDHDIKVESRYVPEEESGDLYLREVDNRLVLPTGVKIRFLHTSADVLHAFWVPELAVKKDAIPGYVTETWAELNREGVFRGQCAELCGTWHSRMPIVVESVSQEKFAAWVDDQKAVKIAAAAEASADKTWSMDELMAKGKPLYETKCGACHQATGVGLPPAFPALKGSALTIGPIADHLNIVLNGKEGTAMQPWNSLNDLEIAAIVTYERNAWDNNTGDVVQPADVKQAR